MADDPLPFSETSPPPPHTPPARPDAVATNPVASTNALGYPQTVEMNPRRSARPPAAKATEPENKDGFREIVETVVFVVVLVLLLKTFLAEAFVIPTGSMATTLLGYHIDVVCEQCNYAFRSNASPQTEDGQPIVSCDCPNCGYRNILRGQPGGRK